jgi:hypothetical protein
VKKNTGMSEDELLSVCRREIEKASEYLQNDIAYQRAQSYDYYWGKPFGNEKEGRSQVISRDVQQSIDSVKPGLIETFIASDRAVEFSPRNAEDIEAAEQQTDVANYVFYTWNNGYQLVHDCITDGLLQKTGVFKWMWEKTETMEEETLQGLDDSMMEALGQEPEVEIIAHSEYQLAAMDGTPMTVHDVTVRKKKESGKAKVVSVPPEEFLISPAATSQLADDAPMIGHVTLKTYSELLELGIPKSTLEEVAGVSESSKDFGQEANARETRSGQFTDYENDGSVDPAMRRYRYYELYPLIDFDRDGIVERRRVCLINKTKVVHNEVVDHVPLSWWSPKIMPHEPIGMSVADDLRDIQFVRSTIRRGALDNLYVNNMPRLYLNEDANVNIDDVLTVRPNGIIRGRGPANNALFPIVIPFVADKAFQMDEQMAQEGEHRTGISRFVQGTDPNSLNKTATHASIVNQASHARTKMYARNFAEFAFKPMFRGIQYLLSKHQDEALVIRLRNRVVPVDPQVWANEYDMTVNVGLGTGNKDQQLAHLQAMTQDIAGIAQSPFGPELIDADKIFNLFSKKSELAGFKDSTKFMNDPKALPPEKQQQIQQMKSQPPPEIQKAQMQIQADQQTHQADQQFKGQEMQATMALEKYKADAQIELERFKAEKEAELAVFKAQLEAQVELQKAQMQPPAANVNIDANEHMKSASEHLKGMAGEQSQNMQQVMQTLANVAQALTEAAQQMNRPKRIDRDPKSGRAIGVSPI